jgi:ribosomal protein L14E/L6E/L27E
MSVEKNSISVGEIVQSLAGRDKEGFFIVMSVDGEYVTLVDGRKRRVQKPKRKKIKHIKKVYSVNEEIAERIKSGKPIGNERIAQAIKIAKQKIQED